MPELGMRFLGGAELALDGAPVHPRRRRSLALLAYLVLTGRPHTRDALAALLSGDVGDSQARKLLRNALTDLGEQGLGGFLLVDRQTVAFNSARPHRLDIAELDALLCPGAAPDPAAMARAAALCEQELLAGLELRDAPLFEDWLLCRRHHVRQQLARIAHRLLEHYLRTGEAAAGIALARRLLAVRPWEEESHRLLMRLLARDGQVSAALAQYDRCRLVLSEELGVEPQPATTALYERLRAGPFAPHHNLPAPAAALVGREADLADLTRHLADPACRLLTLVGLGGSGKTRLALAAATRLATPGPLADDHPFADGVVFVDLAGIDGPVTRGDAATVAGRRLVTASGLALGLVFCGDASRFDQLADYLRHKRLLLILDNLEHLLDGAWALLALLREAPGLTLLATSRVPIGVPDEWAYSVAGLAPPASADAIEQAPAGQLFLREARRRNAHIAPGDRPHIARICRLTGGLPLALVIAAGWLPTLSCADLARALESGGGRLTAPDQPARHRSLRAIVAATWRGLPPRERRALRTLAVFRGHFDQAASEAVGVALPSLRALRERALIEHDGRDGYALHQLVRQYSAEQLAARPREEAQARARHADHYSTTFARQAPEMPAGIGVDRDNLFAAWEWATTHLDLEVLERLQVGLDRWHQLTGLHREWAEVLHSAVERLRAARPEAAPSLQRSFGWLLTAEANAWMCLGDLDRARPPLSEARQCARDAGVIPLEVRANLYEAHILHYQGDVRAAAERLQEALTLARAIRDRRLEAETLLSLGLTRSDVGQYVAAEALLLQAEQAYRDLGESVTVGRLVVHRSRLFIARAEFERATVALEQVLPAVQAHGNQRAEGWAHVYLGEARREQGLHREADECFNRALVIARATGDARHEAYVLCAWGVNALQAGDFARAERLIEQALELGRAVGGPVAVGRALHGLALLAHARRDDARAEELARQALSLADDTGRPPEQAALILLLGQAHGNRSLPTAAAHYARALALARDMGKPALCCDATSGLAGVAMAEGEIDKAADYAAAIMPYLREHHLAGCGEPGWVALTCYCALRAARDPRAAEVLRLGAALLERRIGALPEAWRPRYLATFPARGEVMRLWREQPIAGADQRVAPPIALVLPRPQGQLRTRPWDAATTSPVRSDGRRR